MTLVRVHVLRDMDSREVYNASQCWNEIEDGDVLVASDAVAFLLQAWPTSVAGDPGQFHTLKDRESFLAENPQYADAVAVAVSLSVRG